MRVLKEGGIFVVEDSDIAFADLLTPYTEKMGKFDEILKEVEVRKLFISLKLLG